MPLAPLNVRSVLLLLFTIFSFSSTCATPDRSAASHAEKVTIDLSFHGQSNPDPDELIYQLISFLTNDEEAKAAALKYLADSWTEEYVPMILDVIYLMNDQQNRQALFGLLREKTGQGFGEDIHRWQQWLWNKEPRIFDFHADFMAELYKHIDPRFERYFYDRTDQSLIRLDEVRWGGVRQDGIPPLRHPRMIPAKEADYLRDSDVVFGLEINGEVRAYPKRILAWHEMFVDTIGGIAVAGVYCTLCGTLILYETTHGGVEHELGTSGFLYRSNKLMYDRATQSLWSTIEGRPVIGSLSNKGITLESRSVVTTTWGEWRKRHPGTKVLSLNTGYQRDYGEGVAYRSYFATDELMFRVPKLDKRLRNKAEVLIVRAEGYRSDPLALAAAYLSRNKVYHDRIGELSFVVLTDRSGANRAYASEGVKFVKLKDRKTVVDEKGREWRLEELQLTGPEGRILRRLPAHRIFWFAWYSAYPQTRLVK